MIMISSFLFTFPLPLGTTILFCFYCVLTFCAYCTSVNIGCSSLVHIIQMTVCFLLMFPKLCVCILHYVCILNFLFHSLVIQHLNWFHSLSIVIFTSTGFVPSHGVGRACDTVLSLMAVLVYISTSCVLPLAASSDALWFFFYHSHFNTVRQFIIVVFMLTSWWLLMLSIFYVLFKKQ